MDRRKRKAIQERLDKLAQLNRGRLLPSKVVDEARDPKSPLHSEFDWTDSVAAENWRLHQARDLIRSVKIEITTETRRISVVKYVRDPESDPAKQGYVETAKLATQEDLAKIAFGSELDRACSMMERASSLAIALGFEEDFKNALDRVRQLRQRIDLAA